MSLLIKLSRLIYYLPSASGSVGLELAAGKDGKAVDLRQGHYEVRC